MKQALLDTSVLVSAFLFPGSNPGRLLKLADEGAFALHISPIIWDELNEALRRERLQSSYGYTEADIKAWCNSLLETAFMLAKPLPDIGSVCRDPDDDHVIAAALAGGVDCIVSGDKDLLVLEEHEGIRIVSVTEFLAEGQS